MSSGKKRKLAEESEEVDVEMEQQSSSDEEETEMQDKSEESEEETPKEGPGSSSEEENESEEEKSSESEEEEDKVEEKSSESEEEEEKNSESEEEKESEEEEEKVGEKSEESEEEEEKNTQSEEDEKRQVEVADSLESEEEDDEESEQEEDSSEESEVELEKEPKATQRQPVKVMLPTEKKKPEKVPQTMEQKKPTKVEPPTKKQKVDKPSEPVKLTEEQIQLKALHRVLGPFTKDQMVEILSNAALQYKDLYNDLKAAAGSDVAHRKVLVRGLSPQTTTKKLKLIYSAFGKLEDGAVNMDRSGKSLGHGFVTFSDMEASQRAVEKQIPINIDGCKPSCHLVGIHDNNKVQDPPYLHEESPVPYGQQGNRPDNAAKRKIFVSGISENTTSNTLRHEFKSFGEVEDANVPYDRQTKTNKGYGFVVFRGEAGAKSALRIPKKNIDGRKVTCKLAVRPKSKGGQQLEKQLNKRQHAEKEN